MKNQNIFPDGTPISDWFDDATLPQKENLGSAYVVTEYGIADDGKVHTTEFQNLIDTIAQKGGGVVVIPAGTYLSGALFFKQGVHLYIEEDGVLKGSDDISDYPLCDTRIEGENCRYFPALVNADGVDGFAMCGKGTIDGNGLRSWKAFWIRLEWRDGAINKDEQRARLVYLSNCSNTVISGLKLQNAQFWTCHFYRCDHTKILNCSMYSPSSPVPAPSTDGVDIDVCTDFLIKNCRFEVNDDGIALKGGKGPYADTAPENGSNERVIIEDCEFGFCHACLTCGSESIHNRNIIMRRIRSLGANILFRMKMRPDTPQHYEYIAVEGVTGHMGHFIDINPWTQYFDLKGRKDIPLSYANDIIMRDCDCECDVFFEVKPAEEQYRLSDFCFSNLKIKAGNTDIAQETVDNLAITDCVLTKMGM